MLERSNIGLHLDNIWRIRLPHDGKEISHNYSFFEDCNKMFICYSLDLLMVNDLLWTNVWEAGCTPSPRLSGFVKLLGIFFALYPFFLSLFLFIPVRRTNMIIKSNVLRWAGKVLRPFFGGHLLHCWMYGF